MTFEVHQYPYHRVVYRISENANVVYIGEGLATRLGTTLTDFRIDPATKKPKRNPATGKPMRKYSVLMHDEHGKQTGSAELHYVKVDKALASALPVPKKMKPTESYETVFSTNVENILLALFAWHNGQLPRENGIQNNGNNKGGWIADCQKTLEAYCRLYDDMQLPKTRSWPSSLGELEERSYFKNKKPMDKFLSVWWSRSNPSDLNIGFCSVNSVKGTTVPHMTPKKNPIVKHRL